MEKLSFILPFSSFSSLSFASLTFLFTVKHMILETEYGGTVESVSLIFTPSVAVKTIKMMYYFVIAIGYAP